MKTTAGELRTKKLVDLLERKEIPVFKECIPPESDKDSFLSPLSSNHILQTCGVDII